MCSMTLLWLVAFASLLVKQVSSQPPPQQPQLEVVNNVTAHNRNRLAIIYLVTELNPEHHRVSNLRASLELCSLHIFPTTPTTVYIFTHEDQVPQLIPALADLLQQLPNVHVMPLVKESWKLHPMAENGMKWHLQQFGTSYRIMGDWRLSYMPSFTRDMGHRYVLQMDDDSYVLGPVGYNLVQEFDTKGYVIGARATTHDGSVCTWGLPELTRYFLVTEKVKPTILFEYCTPPNLQGLHSKFDYQNLAHDVSEQERENLQSLNESSGGWYGPILYGNFLMWSLDWWFSPQVNRFVQLCRSSGGSAAYRWNEQDVISMARLVFVRNDQFHMFNFSYVHTRNQNVPLGAEEKYNSTLAYQPAATATVSSAR